MASEHGKHGESSHGKTKDGIAYWITVPKGTPTAKGTIILTHGYTEHSRFYDELADDVVSQNWALVRYDLRGHGESPGYRGHIANFNQYLTDLGAIHEIALNDIKTDTNAILLMGHSVGGLITLRYMMFLKANPTKMKETASVKGLVLVAPFIRVATAVPVASRAFVWLMSKTKPTYENPFHENWANTLSHDQEVCNRFRTDEKVFRHSTLGWFTQCQKAQHYVRTHASVLKDIPTFWFISGQDVVVHSPTTRLMITSLQKKASEATDSTKLHQVEEYPDLYHCLLVETETGRSKIITKLKEICSKVVEN